MMLENGPVEVLDHTTPDMAMAIANLQRAAYSIEADLIGSDAIPTLHETASHVAALQLTMLGIRHDMQPVAILGYSRIDDVVDIDRLAVCPAHHRRGLARRLIETLHDREPDARRFHVSTGHDNLPAIHLYARLGYRRIGDEDLPEGITITRFERTS